MLYIVITFLLILFNGSPLDGHCISYVSMSVSGYIQLLSERVPE